MSIEKEKFATVPLFEGLGSEEILSLLKLAEDVEAKPGDEIVSQGKTGHGFYVIAAGVFHVVRKGETEQKVLAELGELSFFGEMSLVADEPRTASVVCVEAGRLKHIPAERFRQLIGVGDMTAYKVVHNMARVMSKRLARLSDRFVG